MLGGAVRLFRLVLRVNFRIEALGEPGCGSEMIGRFEIAGTGVRQTAQFGLGPALVQRNTLTNLPLAGAQFQQAQAGLRQPTMLNMLARLIAQILQARIAMIADRLRLIAEREQFEAPPLKRCFDLQIGARPIVGLALGLQVRAERHELCGHFPDGCQLVGTHQRRETAPKRRVLDHERVDLIAQGREKSACGIVEARPETFGRTALPIDVLGTGGDDHFAERRDLDSGAQSRLFVALPHGDRIIDLNASLHPGIRVEENLQFQQPELVRDGEEALSIRGRC